MKKVIKNKNRTYKSANNHKIQNHKFTLQNHNVSKEWVKAYLELTPIYQSLGNDFETIDLIDLEFYERWLNG